MAERTLSEAVDNIFVTTWRNVRRKIVDNVFKIRPFYSTMIQNNRIVESEAGGRYHEVPVSYAQQTSNIKWLGRGEEVGQAEDEFLTQYEYPWRYLATGIVRYFQDDQQNRGRSKMHDYVQAKLDNARDSLLARLETNTFTADSSGKGILSLQDLIADDPSTGTVAGINRANSTWARNQARNFSGLTLTSDLIPEMTTTYNLCSEQMSGNRPTPDLIVTTRTVYEEYEARARALQQIVASTSISASLGFGNLSFKGTPIVWAPECPASKIYFINTENMSLVVDRFAYFDMGPWKEKVGSRDRVTQILATLALTCDNFQKQGVMYNVA